MNCDASGKILAGELLESLESILRIERLHPEIVYRIGKLIHRINPLVDAVFFKTVKARQTLAQCSEKTTVLESILASEENHVFLLLTNLEKALEDLVRKTYEFRIKAG